MKTKWYVWILVLLFCTSSIHAGRFKKFQKKICQLCKCRLLNALLRCNNNIDLQDENDTGQGIDANERTRELGQELDLQNHGIPRYEGDIRDSQFEESEDEESSDEESQDGEEEGNPKRQNKKQDFQRNSTSDG